MGFLIIFNFLLIFKFLFFAWNWGGFSPPSSAVPGEAVFMVQRRFKKWQSIWSGILISKCIDPLLFPQLFVRCLQAKPSLVNCFSEDLHICSRNHIIAGLLEGAVKGVHTYPPYGLVRSTCWSQISHLHELKLHKWEKLTTTELAILTNLFWKQPT